MHRQIIRKLIAFKQSSWDDPKTHERLVENLKRYVKRDSTCLYSFVENDIDGIAKMMEDYGELDG